jgi:hypothetical protein
LHHQCFAHRKANGRVLPLVYVLSAPDHFHVEPLRLTLEQTLKLYAFGPLNPLRAHTCEEVSSLSRATDGLRSYHHNGLLPRYIRFRVGDGGDNVYSDHLDIIDPALAISGRRWPLQQLKIVDIQYGIMDVQIDRSVTGKPLSVGGRGFADGFGVHSMTDLTLEVPAFLRGQPGEVAFSYGIDDDTAGAGSADLEVCYY